MSEGTSSSTEASGGEQEVPSPPDSYRVLQERLPERGLAELAESADQPMDEHEERIGDPAVERVVRLSLEANAVGPVVKRALKRLLDEKGRGRLREILGEVREQNDAQSWMWKYVRDPELLWESGGDDGDGTSGNGDGAPPGGGPGSAGKARPGADEEAGAAPGSTPSGERGDSVQELVRTARDGGRSRTVRVRAAEALGRVPSREALEALLELAVRQEGDFHSWRLEEKSPSTVAAIEALSSGVWHDHPAARQARRLALGSDDPDLREAAEATGAA